MVQRQGHYDLFFVRHGLSQANAQKVLQGQGDSPLTPAGYEQARALGAFLLTQGIQFDAILTSPLHRAFETARTLAQILRVPQVEIEPLWQEQDIGRLTLRPEQEVSPIEPETMPLYRPVGETGESFWDLYVRVAQAVGNLMKRDPGTYMVVTHDETMNMAFRLLMGIPPQSHDFRSRLVMPNVGYMHFRYNTQDERWYLMAVVPPQLWAHLLERANGALAPVNMAQDKT